MYKKINCKHFEHGGYCKNKAIKRSIFGIGARVCGEYDGNKCAEIEPNIRPDPPPPPPRANPLVIQIIVTDSQNQ
jgi:hypothetical protein